MDTIYIIGTRNVDIGTREWKFVVFHENGNSQVILHLRFSESMKNTIRKRRFFLFFFFVTVIS